ncbi:MAG: FeoB-associated Cys-rich membrane protein [Treponema sp.]|nr:FeoB-associated Cys-rich membrane protein [Treponema sp.]
MKAFFVQNASTIIVGSVVFAALLFILIRTIRNARKGKSACGCGCASCAKDGSCGKA